MDTSKIAAVENLLRLPGANPANSVVADASVLSCGCLVSESQFVAGDGTCPTCYQPSVILKEVPPLRDLYKLVQQFYAESNARPRRRLSLKRSVRLNSESKLSSFTDSTDLMGLFCKYAKDDALERLERVEPSLLPMDMKMVPPKPAAPSEFSISPNDRYVVERHRTLTTQQSYPEDSLLPSNHALQIHMGFNEKEENNFTKCFPFHRKVLTFPTQQNKLLFKSRTLVKKSTKFSCTAISTRFDRTSNTEKTLFVLMSERKWELYEYTTNGRPQLIACGKLTGEYGPLANEMKFPLSDGIVIRNEFSGNQKNGKDDDEVDGINARLKSWVQLYCCLSDLYLMISGTRGVIRVLNLDAALGDIGSPVYTYLTNFPIRCIAIAPSNNLVACGITARERISGKQQPFIILHKIDVDSSGQVSEVTPITITVPYRDPLKIINFNASSTHLLCSTVYEMRYFIIRLRGDAAHDYKKPRLIWSDIRVNLKGRRKRSVDGESDTELLEDPQRDDGDQMLDNEGITDVKFGMPYTNTVVITSSSLQSRPLIVLKLNGPTIDSRKTIPRVPSGNLYYDVGLHISAMSEHDDDEDYSNISDTDVLMKVTEIGSNIYRSEVSPRGDGIVFVDKLGRLLLVSTPNFQHSLVQAQARKKIVLLGETADALRFSEAASVKFSSDGGKVFAVDRRGLFQVFDFTKGVPGEDPDVIKCKIISV